MSRSIEFICNIRSYRVLHGLTQAELAKLVGVSKNCVSAWENCFFS